MKTQTKSVNFFCLPEELSKIVIPIVDKKKAHVVFLEKKDDAWEAFPCDLRENIWATDREFWIVPAHLTEGHVIKSPINLVQLYFPKLYENHLNMGAISIKSDRSGDYYKSSLEIYSLAKLAIKGEFLAGLWAANIKYGGRSFYDDLYISPNAVTAHQGGILLHPQFEGGNVIYSVDAPTGGV